MTPSRDNQHQRDPSFPSLRLKISSLRVTPHMPPRLGVYGSGRSGGCWCEGASRSRRQRLDSSARFFKGRDDKSSFSHRSGVLVDLEGSDTPVRLTEITGVVLNIVLTAVGPRRTRGELVPNVPSPVATKSGVKGESLVPEQAKVAIALKGSCGNTPASRVWVAVLNISGFGAVAPEPDLDELVGVFGRICSTTIVIERPAIGICTVR